MSEFKGFETLYKYRNWVDENHKNVLIKNQLHLSSPKSFNDPFDCKIPFNFYDLDTEYKKEKWLQKIINDGYEEICFHKDFTPLFPSIPSLPQGVYACAPLPG